MHCKTILHACGRVLLAGLRTGECLSAVWQVLATDFSDNLYFESVKRYRVSLLVTTRRFSTFNV